VNSDNIICIELPGLNPLRRFAPINKAGGVNIPPDRQETNSKEKGRLIRPFNATPFRAFFLTWSVI
jgi:hypothetical protein